MSTLFAVLASQATTDPSWLDQLAALPEAYSAGMWAGLAASFAFLALVVQTSGLRAFLDSTRADWVDEALILVGIIGAAICGTAAAGFGGGWAGVAGLLVATARAVWAIRAQVAKLWRDLLAAWND